MPGSPEAKARVRQTSSPPHWFWEPVDADVRPSSRKGIDLPIAETALARIEGAARVWDDLPPEARERLRRDGVLVVADDLGGPSEASAERQKRSRSMGAFYTQLREQRVPHVLTLDAFFAIIHLGMARALGHVEDVVLAPTLRSFLEKVDLRLAAEERGAGTELAQAYSVARGVIAVARAVEASPPPWTPPPGLAKIVAEERGHIEGHAGLVTSPLLGVGIDYSRFVVPSSAAQPGAYRALAWLGAAPLSLVARSEARGATVDVGRARKNTRAAMLLARVCDREIDPVIHAAYTRLAGVFAFAWGAPDDLTLNDLDAIATANGVDLTKLENIANVTRVDKVRLAAMKAARLPAVHDGGGSGGRSSLGVRLFGGHASADSIVLQSLVGAPAGLAQVGVDAATLDRVRKGQRVLPATLDIAAWLGAPEARALLSETHADAFEGYEPALAAVQRDRDALERGAMLHASVHGSLLDALIAWANAGPAGGVPRTAAAERMRVESLLAGWTRVRHLGHPLAQPRPAPLARPSEVRVYGAPLPVFVEPLPDVIARLVAVIRQVRRGLESLGPMAPSSSGATTLVEIEDVLRTALRAAERHASGEPLSSEEATALASLPARMAKLEEDAGADGVGPLVATVHSDPASGRVLVSATGAIEPVLMLARDPAREEPLLVVGAHVAHHELTVGLEHAPGVLHGVRPAVTDAWWRTRLESTRPAGAAPPPPPLPGSNLTSTRAPWVSSFRFTR